VNTCEANASDEACVACLKATCCDTWVACEADCMAQYDQVQACIGQGNAFGDCGLGADTLETTNNLLTCGSADQGCQSECGWLP